MGGAGVSGGDARVRRLTHEADGEVTSEHARLRGPLIAAPLRVFANPDTVRPSFDAMHERLGRNYTQIGVPKAERLAALNLDLLLTPTEAAHGCTVPVGIPTFGEWRPRSTRPCLNASDPTRMSHGASLPSGRALVQAPGAPRAHPATHTRASVPQVALREDAAPRLVTNHACRCVSCVGANRSRGFKPAARAWCRRR